MGRRDPERDDLIQKFDQLRRQATTDPNPITRDRAGREAVVASDAIDALDAHRRGES